MAETIRKPCYEIKGDTLMCGEDVAQIGAVKNVFESWEDLDPNGWTPFTGNESGNCQTNQGRG